MKDKDYQELELPLDFTKFECSLARWLNWLERHPAHQKVAGLIPHQGAQLGCGFDQGAHGRQPTDRCFSLPLPSLLPLSLKSINTDPW